jgi:tRNA uridine 5-carboxymethylaminomethyl modification enzyme
LGVLVDDLITKGVSEPYRMFTSRAEFRLSLREDNADARLTAIGRELGLVGDAQWALHETKMEAIALEQQRLRSTWVNPSNFSAQIATSILGKPIEHEYSLADLLRRPEVTYADLMLLDNARFAPSAPLSTDTQADKIICEQVETAIKYAGYIERQKEEIAKQANNEHLKIPANLDYTTVKGLSNEVKQKLNAQRPETLGQAARISGITPAAISLVLVHIKRAHKVAGEAQA